MATPERPTHIKNFLDTKYSEYAVYRVAQRLPHIMDSLGQTQRKILYSMEKFPDSKKLKTTEVYSHVFNDTQYLHGDASVYTVVENLARGCSNNISLLTEEGSFGRRTNTNAASPRYTSTRFSKAARLIFRKEDKEIFTTQEFEGKEIEPKFLLPILPVGLVNGFLGIAVGFSSKFLPRDPMVVIDELIKALTLKKRRGDCSKIKIGHLPPYFPYYKGNIIYNQSHANKSAWTFTGLLRKTKTRNVVEVYEVPPEYSRESYLKKLKSMLEKGIIKDFSEECQKDKFLFRVKLAPELWKLTEGELLVKLGLVDNYVENLTFIDPMAENPNESIKKFDTAEEYVKVFMEIRQDFYTIRRDHKIGSLKKEIQILKARIRFIRSVNDGSIVILKRKKIDLELDLKPDYDLVDGSYDYLLGMRMHSLTTENIDRFLKFIAERELVLNALEKITPEDMHIRELKELKKFIAPEVNKKSGK